MGGTSESFVFALAEKAQLTGSTLCFVVAFAVFWFCSTPLVRYIFTNTSYVMLFSDRYIFLFQNYILVLSIMKEGDYYQTTSSD